MSETPKCELCGELMPDGEGMFMYHGYSGPCPKPPLPKPRPAWIDAAAKECVFTIRCDEKVIPLFVSIIERHSQKGQT